MILKKIILNNISSYEGFNEFDFSPQEDKNIILIGGKNGAGKTSLFNAIKIGLYGPLNYNYQSAHSQYLVKIKDIINKKAFTEENVEAFVSVTFDYINVRECTTYELKRSWRYVDQKITETFEVIQDGKLLTEKELTSFDNFLQTILPPNLFSLFFFDGEELSNVFVGSKFNQYVKEAFMVLCNFDSFELIKKHSKNFVARNNTSDEAMNLEGDLNVTLERLDTKTTSLKQHQADILTLKDTLAKTIIMKEDLQKAFKEQGGLAESEKAAINQEIKLHENNKATQSVILKTFVEDLMPFMIVKDMAATVHTQITKEQSHDQQVNALKYLSGSDITKSILSSLSSQSALNSSDVSLDSLSKDIHTALLANLNKDLEASTFTPLHNVSPATQNNLLAMSSRVQTFDATFILEAIASKQASQKATSELNEKLRSAMPEDVLTSYLEKLEELNITILSTQQDIFKTEQTIEQFKEEIKQLDSQATKLRERLKEFAQDKNVYDITQKLYTMLDGFINSSSTHKLRQLESCFKKNFQALFRKEHFIDEINIDEQFNIHIYRKKIFTYDQVEKLINNLGNIEFCKYVGPKSLDILYTTFSIDNVEALKLSLSQQLLLGTEIEIFERVNIQQLSKGEKQIYMLSLYWALIQISAHEVPFIIDTPYARIDTEHRDNVTAKFLPHIAHQVIILSTDEEIDSHYYHMLQPHIAKEYLLVFNTEHKNTQIFNKYFYEVIQ